MYRVVCTFIPSIKYTPTGGKFNGAWRVLMCEPATNPRLAVEQPVMCLSNLVPKVLIISSTVARQPNAWCNPRKILAQWLDARREVRASLAAIRGWDAERHGLTSAEYADWRAA